MSRVLPILFNTDMVRAILDGRKTVTRRVMKPANPFRNKEGYRQGDGLWIDGYNKNDEPNGHIKDYSVSDCWLPKEYYIGKYAPYQPGDILYVRETYMDYAGQNMYKADCDKYRLESLKLAGFEWHPSIHMPKEAARIWLKVTDVRVERLQDIDCNGAIKEGIDPRCCINLNHAVVKFSKLWNSTIKKSDLDRYGWDASPWVWVTEFERCEKPEEL